MIKEWIRKLDERAKCFSRENRAPCAAPRLYVEEFNFERDGVSWISPLGKALLAADLGSWIKLDDGRNAKIVRFEFKQGQM